MEKKKPHVLKISDRFKRFLDNFKIMSLRPLLPGAPYSKVKDNYISTKVVSTISFIIFLTRIYDIDTEKIRNTMGFKYHIISFIPYILSNIFGYFIKTLQRQVGILDIERISSMFFDIDFIEKEETIEIFVN